MIAHDPHRGRSRRGAASAWIVTLGVLVGLVAMGAGLVSTRDANVQDDPEYCASCHSVETTLDSLLAGGHAEMSCLACHTTDFRGQARVGLAQLVGAELPTDHPTFSNRESCESCHVGDDASSDFRVEGIAAHEVHLFSQDPEVAGMACTSCHLPGDHGFTPATSGCTAARCHSDIEIRLGQMAHEGLDCADCHALPDTVVPGDTTTLLIPSAVQCLACHDMQEQLPDFDTAGDPHGNSCNWCHKPHTQSIVEEAARTCTNSGCHTRPDTLATAHRGLAPGVLEGCVGCHAPHRAHVAQQDCTACHDATGGLLPGVTGPPPPGTPGSNVGREAERDGGRPGGPGTADLSASVAVHTTAASLIPVRLGSSSQVTDRRPHRRDGLAAGWARLRDRVRELRHRSNEMPSAATVSISEVWSRTGAVRHAPRDTTLNARFAHEEHTSVDCVSCHTPDGSEHGQLTVQTASDCRQCHHVADDAPTCATCHDGSEPGGSGIVRTMTLDLSVLDRIAYRDVPFSHAEHAEEDCATCHLPSLTRSAEAEDCQSCHAEHHEAALTCSSCHVEAPQEEHPIAQVHLGCGGAGCHTDAPAPLDSRLRERATCLTCHDDQAVDHYDPAASCSTCHLLPPPHARGGA